MYLGKSKISVLVFVLLLFFGLGSDQSILAMAKSASPTITVSPSNGQTGVEVSAPITIQFGESIKLANGDPLTSKNAGKIVTLQAVDKNPNIEIEMKWSPTNKKLTIQPKNPLLFGTKYRVGFKKGQVKNQAGVLNEEVSSVFTTERKEPPLAVVFEPKNQAVGVPIDTKIRVVLNKPMLLANKKQITDATIPTFIIIRDAKQKKLAFTGHWDDSSQTAIIDPVGNLAPGTTYTMTVIEKKLKDRQGLMNEESFSSTFTTEVPVDVIAPTVTVLPAHGAKNIPLSATVTIQFAEEIVLSTGEELNSKTFSDLVMLQDRQQATVKYYATWNKSKRIITLHVKDNLKPYTAYTIRIPSGVVKDLAGNPNGEVIATFTTKGK
ncbi:Ig-like domain-containing protein [Brevibacillus ginsengisoli]|uniref:Ig-like domain-containing protein n=1 Tax=Brevibacillus ginsengisoli TaxID=363854 RepID=UPI003CEFC3A4